MAPWRQRLDRGIVGVLERGLRWAFAHWLLLANASTALILTGAVSAPLLVFVGLGGASEAFHAGYLLLCPQRPTHSYYLLGQLLALEQRELAMFAAQPGGGLIYARIRGRWGGRLGVWSVLLLSLPMAWDGLTQAFALRDSDWQTRAWTGALFDVAFVFWFYPLLEYQFRARTQRVGPLPIAGVQA